MGQNSGTGQLKDIYTDILDLQAQSGDEFADAMFADIDGFFDEWLHEML